MRNLLSAQTKMEVKQAGLRLPPSQLQVHSVVSFGEAGLKWHLATGQHFKECLVADGRVAVVP